MAYLWQFVIGEDRRLDLTHPDRGRDWGYVRVIGIGIPGEDGSYQPDPHMMAHFRVPALVGREPLALEPWFDVWVRNVRALRSLAGRLAGAKTRRPGIAPAAADEIFYGYMSLPARVEVVRSREEEPAGRRRKTYPAPLAGERITWVDFPSTPLTRQSFLTLKLRPGPMTNPLHDYWQDVFLSLASSLVTGPLAVPLCSECGNELPRTPAGRPSRRGMCPACRYKVWKAAQGPKEMRKRWKRAKGNQRARDGREEGS